MKNRARYRFETEPERLFREALERRGLADGVDFCSQHPLRFSYILDFAFPAVNLAVEVDGVRWHTIPKMKQRDRVKDLVLKRRGWKVIRFTDLEVESDPDGCADKVISLVRLGAQRPGTA